MSIVYGLFDPIDDALRYVGASRGGKIAQRLCDHKRDKKNKEKAEWITKLSSSGLEPIIRVLEEVPEQDLNLAEKRLIKYYREQGCNLLNHSIGGEGTVGVTPPKIRSCLFRIEEDTFLFLHQEANRRRVTISQVVRDLLYRLMEPQKGKSNELRDLRKGNGAVSGPEANKEGDP